MKLHLSPTEPKISIISTDHNGNSKEQDVTYDSLLLASALISMFHDGSVTVNSTDGKPIFDMTITYHDN